MADIKYITEYAHNSLDEYTGAQQKFLDARQSESILISCVLTDSFKYSDIRFRDGVVESSTIEWPDGDIGELFDVVYSSYGVESISYSRSNGKVYTMNIEYTVEGLVKKQEILIS